MSSKRVALDGVPAGIVRFRLVSAWEKVAYLAAWFIILTAIGVLSRLVLPAFGLTPAGPAETIFSLAALTVYWVVGIRAFRGRDEPRLPTREWWRVAGGWRSAAAIGLALGAVGIWESIAASRVTEEAVATSAWVGAVQTSLGCVAYAHSAVRLFVRSRASAR